MTNIASDTIGEKVSLSGVVNDNELFLGKKLWHPEKERMKLAYYVLNGIFVVFILSILLNLFAHKGCVAEELSNSLLDLCRYGMLPIITLILGFYFSKNN